MLVLSRKVSQEIVIRDDIRIIVRKITPASVKLAVDAPADVSIVRSELPRVNHEYAADTTPD